MSFLATSPRLHHNVEMRICFAVLMLALFGCPKPTTVKKVEEPTPLARSDKSLQELMRSVQELSEKASAALAEGSSFSKLSGEVAMSLLLIRDQHSPEPGFYKLADASYQAATKGTRGASTLDERTAQWEEVQKTCQACHLRYGGPVSKAVSMTPFIDSLSRSNP
jgi:hypothetical protein